MRLTRLLIATAAVAVLAADPPKPAEPVRLNAVKYDDLGDAVRKLKGKVVVLDFWADYCLPCKREFPKLVALHRKYAADGLSAVSVSLDEKTGHDGAKAFLEARGAAFANYRLDEVPAVWQAKLKVQGPPLVYVFNRRGELEQKFADDIDYAAVEKLAAELLKQ